MILMIYSLSFLRYCPQKISVRRLSRELVYGKLCLAVYGMLCLAELFIVKNEAFKKYNLSPFYHMVIF